jgi:hypothetical protein
VPAREANGLGEAGNIEQDVGRAFEPGNQVAVEGVHQVARSPGDAPVGAAEQGLGEGSQRLDDAGRAAVAAQVVAEAVDHVERLRRRGIRRLQRERARVERQQHGIAARPVEGRLRVENFARIEPVGNGHALQRHAVAQGAADQRGYDQIEGAVAQHAQPEGRQRGKRGAARRELSDGGGEPAQIGGVERMGGERAQRRPGGVERQHLAEALLEVGGRARQPGQRFEQIGNHRSLPQCQAARRTIAVTRSPTLCNACIWPADRWTPNSCSTPSISCTLAMLSQPSTSAAVVSARSTMASSSRTSRKIRFRRS